MTLVIILIIIAVIILLILVGFKIFLKKVNETLMPITNGLSLGESFGVIRDDINNKPRSIGGLDNIYLDRIKKDFPDLNINDLKSKAKTCIINYLRACEAKDEEAFKESENINTMIRDNISDLGTDEIHFYSIKIHNTVISKYEKSNGVATICFKSSVGYDKDYKAKQNHVETVFETEFIYIVDESKVSKKLKVLGLNCPNCGAPIKGLGEKKCFYCGTGFAEIAKRTWVINNIAKI